MHVCGNQTRSHLVKALRYLWSIEFGALFLSGGRTCSLFLGMFWFLKSPCRHWDGSRNLKNISECYTLLSVNCNPYCSMIEVEGGYILNDVNYDSSFGSLKNYYSTRKAFSQPKERYKSFDIKFGWNSLRTFK